MNNRIDYSAPSMNLSINRKSSDVRHIATLRKGIWVYFCLLILEGALRKWILPSMASPLLIVRDPVAIWLMAYAYYFRVLRVNGYVFAAYMITLVSLLTTLFYGHGNISASLYGARIMIIQFPVIFIIGKVFDYETVIKLSKILLIITPFMTILVAMQFFSPQSALVNRGIGGDMAGAGFSGAMGYFRPPGTFSFISGLTSFYGLVAPVILFFWLNTPTANKFLLVISSLCLIAAIPMSISRTLLFHTGLTIVFAIFIGLRRPRFLIQIFLSAFIVAGLIAALSNLGFFQIATEAFTSRFDAASKVEGGLEGTLGDRVLGGMLTAIQSTTNETSFWGKGLGMGTNAGAKLMTGTNKGFLVSEEEWGRLLGEMGLLLGMSCIILRCSFTLKMGLSAFRAIRKDNIMPWLLMSFTGFMVLQGQWAQPTVLGFSIFSAGLVLASLNKKLSHK